MRTITIIALAMTLTGASLSRAADSPLDAAIALYMSASYEDALAALNQLSPAADLDQADKYRALCLLGLNRPQEAAATIDKLVTRKPLLKVDESDSPKLVVMLREAQTRLIPGVARSLFATAKQDFERGQIAASASEFRQVLALISEVGHTGDATLADLKMLADGFGKLADQQLAAPPPAAPAVENDRGARSPAPTPEKWKIYDAGDTDVAPPIAVAQRLPVWAPRDQIERNKYSGTVEVVIDESGNVSAATITAPVFPSYDQLLLQAAKSWRYKPARRAGQPVKYRRAVAVLLTPKAAT